MITPRNLIRHELIGLGVEVVNSTNKSCVGIKGIVVNETKNTLEIKTQRGCKKVQKKGTSFVFRLQKKSVKVDGSLIVARPEDRIKIKVRKW